MFTFESIKTSAKNLAPKLLSVMETCLDAAVWTNIAIQLLESIHQECSPMGVAAICFELAALSRLLIAPRRNARTIKAILKNIASKIARSALTYGLLKLILMSGAIALPAGQILAILAVFREVCLFAWKYYQKRKKNASSIRPL